MNQEYFSSKECCRPDYSAKIKFYLEVENFIIKTASTEQDLDQIFALRGEAYTKVGNSDKFDSDEFDHKFDHIMVIDSETSLPISCYRARVLEFGDYSYTGKYFEFDAYLKSLQENSKVLELGRAYVQSAYRDGLVINLLWKGIAEYIKISKAHYLMGLSSIFDKENLQINEVCASLLHEYQKQSIRFDIFPLNPVTFVSTNEEIKTFSKRNLPGLIRSYLSAGAIIYPVPGYDSELNCYDFFTLLNLDSLNPRFRERYL